MHTFPDDTFVLAAREYLSMMRSTASAYKIFRDGGFGLGLEAASEGADRLLSRGPITPLDPAFLARVGPASQGHPLPETEAFSIHRPDEGPHRPFRLVAHLPGTRPAVVAVAAPGSGFVGVWKGPGDDYTDQIMATADAQFLADNRVDLLARAGGHEFRHANEVRERIGL